MIRTRFAPSPTGYLHLGGLRTALYTYLFAKSATDGKFILRIEDTDQEREVPGAVDMIYKTHASWPGWTTTKARTWAAITAPTSSPSGADLYMPYALELVEMGAAYPCFCTKEASGGARGDAAAAKGEQFKYDKHCLHIPKEEAQRRMEAGEPYVIRQNIPLTGTASFDDALYGHVEVDCDTLDDNVLIKARRPAHLQLRQRNRRPSDGHHPRHARHRVPELHAQVQPALRGFRLGNSPPTST